MPRALSHFNVSQQRLSSVQTAFTCTFNSHHRAFLILRCALVFRFALVPEYACYCSELILYVVLPNASRAATQKQNGFL
eukprot:2189865-Pleurochrysis_carterae.AAC.1